jgi:hypothetical protein
MNSGTERSEKRSHTRFPVQDGVVAVPRSSLTKIGKVIDISIGGLAVRCPRGGSWLNGSGEIDLLLLDNEYYIHKIPVSIVHEGEFGNGNSGDHTYEKRCNLRFEELTSKQKTEIDYFIRTFTLHEKE